MKQEMRQNIFAKHRLSLSDKWEHVNVLIAGLRQWRSHLGKGGGAE